MGFWIALQFLTVIPSPFHRQPRPEEIGSAVTHFPVIGILTGAVLYFASLGLSGVFPQAVAAALTLVVWVIIGGAMHLDGLMDTCDGLAGDTARRRLEIMADSHTGAYGVVGAFMVLLVKYAALVSLPEAWRWQTLLLTPLLGSWVLVLAIFVFPYARQSGLGQQFKSGASRYRFALATLLTLAISFVVAGWPGLVTVAAASLVTLAIGGFFKPRLGGLTGDVYGATREITEAIILFLIPAIAGMF